MAETQLPVLQAGLGQTQRRDAWWLEILPVILVLGAFFVYANFRAFEGALYSWGPYLSPFYSPLIDPNHHWWPWSPAFLILAIPGGFRVTCYYYRKAYYRAFFLDPPSCAVGEPKWRKGYKGETKFPFVLQNLHRYLVLASVIFLVFLWKDVIHAFNWNGHFGIGVGTLVMLVNVVLLTLYVLSCHSVRHVLGGRMDCFSCTAIGRQAHTAWKGVSSLNGKHMLFAWLSLFTVGLTDLYIRLVASGVIHDFKIL